mgnify:FL=1
MSPVIVLLMVVMSFFMGFAMGFNSDEDDF